MFWADEIATAVLTRRPSRPIYRVHDYKTPSGHIHVGSLRGVVIHNMVARAIAEHGAQAHYLYGFDDFDPMDGFPVYLPDSFKQYMGQPLSTIPSPDPTFEGSFGAYYAQEFINVFNQMGIEPEIVYASQMYQAGAYNVAIKIALDQAATIRQIYKDISGAQRAEDWFPLSVVCPNCGKIGTTRVYAWDGEQVSYKCEPNMVKWATGCGHEGQISPFNGQAKLPYKVEWAAKWLIFDEDFETAGKDHMTKNGSHDVASAIARQVYKLEPPIGREYPYEFLLIEGKKMSSSKGLGVRAHEIGELLPPHLLHFFIASGKPNRQLNFTPTGNTMPLLYDAYDSALAAYRADPNSELAKVISYTKAPNQVIPDYSMRFSKLSFISQMPNLDVWQEAEKEKGQPLTPEEKTELGERIEYAKQWLAEFAPDELKFTLQTELPTNLDLSVEQKEFLTALRAYIEAETPDGTNLHTRIHQLRAEHDLQPRDAFAAIYRVFLNKDSGPQAGWFLAALDRELVLKRLNEISK